MRIKKSWRRDIFTPDTLADSQRKRGHEVEEDGEDDDDAQGNHDNKEGGIHWV